jgi:membrane-associated phospholipid phosphatase
MLLVAGFCSFWWLDHVVSNYFVKTDRLPGDIANLFEAVEHFGTVWGQVITLWALWVLDRKRGYLIPRIAAAAIAGGLAADLFKLGISRIRPKRFDFAGLGIEESFTGWLSFGSGGADFQSFPSGHTAAAVAFAVMLAWVYPRARTMFLAFAGLVAIQRIECTAHFVSDTFVGAAIGWWIGCWFVEDSAFTRWWCKRETQWRTKNDAAIAISIASQHNMSELSRDTVSLGQEMSRAFDEPLPLNAGGSPAINHAATIA